jgi:hypothetical protein
MKIQVTRVMEWGLGVVGHEVVPTINDLQVMCGNSWWEHYSS